MKGRKPRIRWARNAAVCLAAALFAITITSAKHDNNDARPYLLALGVVGIGSALAAAYAAETGRRRLAGFGLLGAALSPTFFAWPLTLVSIAAGTILLTLRPVRGRQ